MEPSYYSNLIKPLVNHCKKILQKLKLYQVNVLIAHKLAALIIKLKYYFKIYYEQIERSIISSQSTSINWYIVIFILSLLVRS